MWTTGSSFPRTFARAPRAGPAPFGIAPRAAKRNDGPRSELSAADGESAQGVDGLLAGRNVSAALLLLLLPRSRLSPPPATTAGAACRSLWTVTAPLPKSSRRSRIWRAIAAHSIPPVFSLTGHTSPSQGVRCTRRRFRRRRASYRGGTGDRSRATSPSTRLTLRPPRRPADRHARST